MILETELKIYYRSMHGGIFLDSTDFSRKKVWKELEFLAPAQKRKTHHRTTLYTKIKSTLNSRLTAEFCNESPVTVDIILRNAGIRRYFATSHRELVSFFFRPCSFIVQKFGLKV